MDGGPVGMDIWIKYIGDSLWGYKSTDAAPLTGVHDINIIIRLTVIVLQDFVRLELSV